MHSVLSRNQSEAETGIAYLPTNASLYYGITMDPAIALFFGWVSSNDAILLTSELGSGGTTTVSGGYCADSENRERPS